MLSTCKKCNDTGNDTNHKCTECLNDYISLGSNCFQSCNKRIIEKNQCIDNCNLDIEYKLEYNNTCYKSCPNGTIVSSQNNSCIENQKDENTEITFENIENLGYTDINPTDKTTESTDINIDTIYTEKIIDSSDIIHDIENNQKNIDEAIKKIEHYITNGLMDLLLSNVIRVFFFLLHFLFIYYIYEFFKNIF